jgi:AsmA protein
MISPAGAAHWASFEMASPEASMKKFVKIIGIIVVVLIVIVIALPLFVNVNRFKPTIESDVSTALGRKVTIGNISLALFSGGVEVDDVLIADDPAFSQNAFLQAKKVTAGVALLPLIFSGKLEVSSFTISEPQVSLLRSKSGVWNFSSMGAAGAKAKSKPKEPSSPTNIGVEKLKISNGTVVVGTGGAHAKTQTYTNVDLEASDLSFTAQFPFKFSATTPGGGQVKMDGKAGPIDATDAALTPLDAKIDVENFDVATSGAIDPSAGIGAVISFSGDVASDGHQATSKGTLKANKIKVKPAGTPATVPVDVDYDTAYDLKTQAGTLKQGDVHIGKGLARLTGSFDLAGESPVLNMKLNGEGMPITDLEGMLPAAAINLPPGASLKAGTLNLNLAITGPVDKLVITGPVNLSDGKIGGFNLKSKLASFPGMGGGNSSGGGSDTEIQTLSTDLHVDPTETQTTNMNIVVPSIGTVTGNGTVSPTGQLNFKMSAKLAGAMGSVMTLGNKNSQGVPFTITGTTSNPVFLPDMKGMATSMAKDVAGAPTGAAKAAAGSLGGLFGKKKQN